MSLGLRCGSPILALALTMWASAASAASLPSGAHVRVGRHGSAIDVAKFRRLVARRYHVELRRVIAMDLDRDGDVDIVAATDHGFTVWLNDGSGRLTAHAAPAPAIARRAQIGLSAVTDVRRDEGMPDESPTGSVLTAYAHAPPACAAAHTIASRSDSPLDTPAVHSASRAPPSA